MKVGTPLSSLRRFSVAWRLTFGRPGLLGIACLLVAAYVGIVYGPALKREQAELLRRQTESASKPVVRTQRLTPASAAAPLLDSLPPGSQRGADLAKLIDISRRAEVELTRGDYSVEKLSAGSDASAAESVSQWRLQLPVRGTYPQLRRFIADLLNTLPHAALDGLQIDRPDTQQPWLETTLRVTFYYRGGGS